MEAKRRGDNAVGRFFQIGFLIDHDRVLAAHFRHNPLDPDLAGRNIGCQFIDSQTDFFGTGEVDEVDCRVFNDVVADNPAPAGNGVEDAGWQASFGEGLGQKQTGD